MKENNGKAQACPSISSFAPGVLLRAAAGTALLVLVVFAKPLFELTRFALSNDLYSHIVLIPAISAYLIWMKRPQLSLRNARLCWPALILVVAGLALSALQWLAPPAWFQNTTNYLSLNTYAFVFVLVGTAWFLLGTEILRPIAFPVAMILFLAPFPEPVIAGFEAFLQRASAEAAQMLLSIAGIPYSRDAQIFHLPGISVIVARECSGIHSTLVLIITSLLASYIFLRSSAKRAILLLAIIPLAILRNGFRIAAISWLCVHIDPSMIDSTFHRRGGPIFFACH